MTDMDLAPLLENAFAIEPVEESYRIEAIDGEIPGYLRGSYYLNGPALFARGDRRYRHWLDGDGMVSALRFDGDGVRFTHRFVRSTKLTDEESAGRFLYRAFGTSFEDDRLMRGIGLQSPVNISAYPAFGTLLAFGEQGLPWELDPVTLETRREYSFSGGLNPVSPFSAHPNIDADTGEMFNFGISFQAHEPSVHVYRFAADGARIYRRRLPIDLPRSVHDFGISRDHAVIHLSPHLLEMDRLLEGGTLLEALSWRPELGGRILVVRREDGERVAMVELDTSYSLHQINCFDRDGQLVMDVLELDRPVYDQYTVPELFRDVRDARPARYVVDLEAERVVERTALDFDLMCDFPAIDPRLTGLTYDDFWVLAISQSARPGRKFFDRLAHLRWSGGESDVYQAPRHHYFGGEPLFLADPGHARRGTIICQQLDAERRRGSFLLFEAHNVAAGPVAELHLERPVRLGFHAAFAPSASDPHVPGGSEGAR